MTSATSGIVNKRDTTQLMHDVQHDVDTVPKETNMSQRHGPYARRVEIRDSQRKVSTLPLCMTPKHDTVDAVHNTRNLKDAVVTE